MRNEFIVAAQNVSEIAFAPVQLFEIPGVDVLIYQDRKKLVGVESIFVVGL